MLNFLPLITTSVLLFVIAKTGDNSSTHLKGTIWLIYMRNGFQYWQEIPQNTLLREGKNQGTEQYM